MDHTTTSEQQEEDRTSLREGKRKSCSPEEDEEYPSVQDEAKPTYEQPASGSYIDADHLQQSVNRAQDKSSPRVSFTRPGQNSERGSSFHQHEHDHRDSTSSSSPSPPPEPERSIYQLSDATRSSQDNSQSCAYVPFRRLMPAPPRDKNVALGKLTAAAKYKMTTDSPNDMEWRKKQKVKGKGKQAERWDVMFDRLVQFQKEHGHCLVPKRYPEDPALASWVWTQRRQHKILVSGQTDQTKPITEERASKLESIGFAWATRRLTWETRYVELLQYKERFGDSVVPTGWKENPKLAHWVSYQRQQYKLFRQGKKSRMTLERVMLLDAVGFVWEAQFSNHRKRKTASKKRDLKLEPSRAEQGLAGDKNNVANMFALARQAFDGNIPPPNTGTLRPDIPPADAFLSLVSSLATAQQQSNGPHTMQRGALEAAAAARMVDDAMAQQNRNPMLRAPTPHFSPALLPGTAHSPVLHDIAQSVASPNHVSSHLKTLAFADAIAKARQLQERRDIIAATNHLNGSYEEQIITKPFLQALRQESDTVRQIRDLIDVLRDDTTTGRPFSMTNDAPRRAHHQIQQPLTLPHQLHPPLGTSSLPGRNESETEASRFGVALQMGDIVRPSSSHRTNALVSDGTLTVGASAPMGTVGTDLSPLSWEDRKPPARRDIGRSSGLSTCGEWNNANTPGNASDVPRSPPNKGTSSVAKLSSSGGSRSDEEGMFSDAQSDEEGMFSDAEEDETATAFLAAAWGSARHCE